MTEAWREWRGFGGNDGGISCLLASLVCVPTVDLFGLREEEGVYVQWYEPLANSLRFFASPFFVAKGGGERFNWRGRFLVVGW